MEGSATDPVTGELAAARVHNVLLGTASAPDPLGVVDRLLCVQAQEHAFSRWSVAQRTPRPDEAAVLAALASGEVVRTHVLRPTWHYLRGADLRWVQELTGPRVRSLSAGWYRNHGADDAFFTATRTVIEAQLVGGNCRTRDELKQALGAANIDVAGQRMAAALFDLELRAVICSGPVKGRHHTYALVDEVLPASQPLAEDEATALLVGRYLRGHGPALLKDLRWWSTLTLKQLQRGVEDLGAAVTSTEVGGAEYLWLADHPPAPEPDGRDDVRFRLLQVFDELFVGYSESRSLVDPDGEFGSVLPIGFSKMMHVVLEGDRLVGRWRSDKRRGTTPGKDDRASSDAKGNSQFLEITVELTRPLSAADRRDLERAAEAYASFVGTEAVVTVREANTR